MSEAGVFSGPYLPMGQCDSSCTARLPVIGHSGLPPLKKKKNLVGRTCFSRHREIKQIFMRGAWF
jgi:hypothetical protein